MTTLFTHIKSLVNVRDVLTRPLRGKELEDLPCIDDAWLLVHEGRIHSYGLMSDKDIPQNQSAEIMDCTGRFLIPTWCDSHTHLVFAGSRENEFVDKIKGAGYAEIAAKGGGILASARRLNDTSEEELFAAAKIRLNEIIQLGTGAIEIKSGYGLTLPGELKMLRVIRRLKQEAGIPVKATFLGAHAFPEVYKNNRQAYLDCIIKEMLPQIAAERLADYIDVFCEKGFFTPEETEQICKAGLQYGLKPKIHVNQLSLSGGVETGVRLNALSVDHLECMDDQAINILASAPTIGTLLPSAAFFLRMQYPPARHMLEAGCALAIASDYNPGSSPSGNMNLVISLACIQMRMTPEEAINAATINGAFAMESDQEVGSITIGKRANLILTKPVPSLAFLPYAFGRNSIARVMINGTWR